MHKSPLLIAFLVAAVLVPALGGANAHLMSLFILALVYGGIALAWAMLGNLGGMVSFGHSAFFGLGAYGSAILATRYGFPVPLSIVLGGICASAGSLAMLPALRLRGVYFALAILAYAHIFRIVAVEWTSMTQGAAGIGQIPALPGVGLDGLDTVSPAAHKVLAYGLILAIVAGFVWVYRTIRASDYGLALRAMRENEAAVRAAGVNIALARAFVLLVSAFMTGVIGAFNAHYIQYLDPDLAFDGAWVTLPIVAAIAGGYRTLSGPIVGALCITLIDQTIFKTLLPSSHQLLLGVLLCTIVLFCPAGLVPRFFDWYRRKRAAA